VERRQLLDMVELRPANGPRDSSRGALAFDVAAQAAFKFPRTSREIVFTLTTISGVNILCNITNMMASTLAIVELAMPRTA